MDRELTCIQCPQGCRLKISGQGGTLVVQGNKCPRGLNYAQAELTNPSRTLTTTVRTSFPDFPLLPVRTLRDVPLAQFFAIMGEINSVHVVKRLRPGDVVLSHLIGTDVPLIATADMNLGLPEIHNIGEEK